MGVPKFYRWVSERYPCLSSVVQQDKVPPLDALYLDMNGIIHNCSHPNDNDPHFRITEEKIFEAIFSYIDVLFRIIQPKKLFYMAIDGCAPRAKMNQQRARRFRSAKDAEEALKKAERKGEAIAKDPDNPPFDSNCITPGTPFMARLHEQLKYYVNRKITTDAAWGSIRVVYSGHNVPGEGEHKIMDFIRAEKARPDYDPLTRHCMYGLDADLMILGLASHEPYFFLLREEVKFGGRQSSQRESSAEAITFHLLSLSLFREYLNLEFGDLADKLSFPYDLERVIDDWVLMGFLVGNDFLPHLPGFHIGEDIFPEMFGIYKKILPTLDGWLTKDGVVNMDHLAALCAALGKKVDHRLFEDQRVNLRFLEGKRAKGKGKDTGAASSGEGDDADDAAAEADLFDEEFARWKQSYYREKMGIEFVDEEFLAKNARTYAEGLQWVLSYYYHGVPSWSWFFPSHYAPYVSDLGAARGFVPNFNLGRPFRPFEQLMAVLPAASRQHVPLAYQPLMTEATSPIIDFYPEEFTTDLNGKRADWEALVLIPFIDQDRLLDAMAPCEKNLTADDRYRNEFGPPLCYQRDPSVAVQCHSDIPTFPDFVSCARLEEMTFPHSSHGAIIGLLPSLDLKKVMPGFPSFKQLPFLARKFKAGVTVFNQPSRSESVIVSLETGQQPDAATQMQQAQELIGQEVFVSWPTLTDAYVTAVSCETHRFTVGKDSRTVKRVNHTAAMSAAWRRQADEKTTWFYQKKGVQTGDVHVLLHVALLDGVARKFLDSGVVEQVKRWATTETVHPFQTIVSNAMVAKRDRLGADERVEEVLSSGTCFFYLGNPFYGHGGQVKALSTKKKRVEVSVRLEVRRQPNITRAIGKIPPEKYFPFHMVARKVSLPFSVLGRLTSSVYVYKGSQHNQGVGKYDVGLKLKFSKRNEEVLGYSRRTPEGEWLLSEKTVQVMLEYRARFPELFTGLLQAGNVDRFFELDLVPEERDPPYFQQVSDWLKTLPTFKAETVPVGSIALSDVAVAAIESAVDAMPVEIRIAELKVHPRFLFLPSRTPADPDSQAEFFAGDRVVAVCENGAVPLGAYGTVVGILGGSGELEVVFDEPFPGGITLGGRCSTNRGYRFPREWAINLSHGDRKTGGKADSTFSSLAPGKVVLPAAATTAASASSSAAGQGAAADLTPAVAKLFNMAAQSKPEPGAGLLPSPPAASTVPPPTASSSFAEFMSGVQRPAAPPAAKAPAVTPLAPPPSLPPLATAAKPSTTNASSQKGASGDDSTPRQPRGPDGTSGFTKTRTRTVLDEPALLDEYADFWRHLQKLQAEKDAAAAATNGAAGTPATAGGSGGSAPAASGGGSAGSGSSKRRGKRGGKSKPATDSKPGDVQVMARPSVAVRAPPGFGPKQ
eukprot:m.53531 g.53531  ORF g.53531 m.53531 type:complete len:1392 (-) comp12390_c0_seq3:40-4215(-)